MIVVDTNIIAYRFIEGDKTNKVIQFQQKESDWIVPILWRFEFLNVLSTLIKNKFLTTHQGIMAWQTAYKTLKPKEQLTNMEKTLIFSIENQISAYDAQYITLAQSRKIRCLTEDKMLLKKFPQITISL